MQVRLLQTLQDVKEIEVLWRALYNEATNRQVFLSVEWHLCWLKTFRRYVRRLYVFCAFDNDELIAVLPLYQHVREPLQLRFIGTGEPERCEVCSEYHDILSKTPTSERMLTMLASAIARTGHAIVLENLRHESVLLSVCRQIYPKALTTQSQIQTRFFLTLSNDELDGTKLKKKARRFYNLVQRLGGELTVCDSTETLPEYFAQLVALHKKRWGKHGRRTIFDDKEFVSFHQSVAGELLASGELLLACVRINGKAVAAFYGMISGEAVYFYQSGIDDSFTPNVSPGTVIHYMVAMEAHKRGLSVYDFLGSASAEDYKSRLTDEQEPLYRFSGYRSSVQRLLCLGITRLRSVWERFFTVK